MNRFTMTVVASVIAVGTAHAEVTEDDLANDQSITTQVMTNGMGRHLQRYSPLDMLNKDNVKNLLPAWAFSLGGEKQRGQETQALIYDGMMYITGSYSRLYAIDLETGKEVWQYDARLPEGILPCCDVLNRGAAIYGDKVIFGTLDARIVALNKATGDVVWRDKIADYKAGCSYTAAPLIVDGLVITGNPGGYFYVLNREDGAFVSANPFVKDITWASGVDGTGRPVFVEDNRPGDPASAADGKKGEVIFASPSFLGGKNWMPMAFSQRTGNFYVPSNEWGMDIWNEPISYKKGAAYLGAGFTIKPN